MDNTFEVVQEHKYEDIYRITQGVLLVVRKYVVSQPLWYWGDTRRALANNQLKKLDGLKKLYETTEDIPAKYVLTDYILPKGSIIYNDDVIESVEPSKYYYELKTTGTSFSGRHDEFMELMSIVNDIVESKYNSKKLENV